MSEEAHLKLYIFYVENTKPVESIGDLEVLGELGMEMFLKVRFISSSGVPSDQYGSQRKIKLKGTQRSSDCTAKCTSRIKTDIS